MRPRLLIFAVALLVFFAAAFALLNRPLATNGFAVSNNSIMVAQPTMLAAMIPMDGMIDVDERQEFDDEAQQPPGVDRVVLKNAVLAIVVDDVDSKIAQISALAEEFGGWVVNAQVSRAQSDGESRVSYGTITVRVDADRLDEAMRMIKDGTHEVESESVTGQDVTQDYVDLSGRVANLEAAEQQLQEIMQSANKTEDVLSVYSELVRVRGEIEQIRGRLNYYDEAAAYSSIQISLRPTPVIQPVEIAGWRPLETARNAFQALVDVLRGAADVAIAVAVFALPLLVLVGLPAWWLLRRRRLTHAA